MSRTVIFILLILHIVPCIVKAQEDYFYTYKSLNIGSTLEDGGQAQNAGFCQIKKGNGQITRYTPYEVREYGFKDGRVFIAKDIQVEDTIKRVFLERLVNGKMILYFYKGINYKEYYIEKESGQLILLSGGGKEKGELNYRNTLRKYTDDCTVLQEPLSLIIYKEKSLVSFVDAYNKCELREFPYIKYGIMVGYGSARLLIPGGIKLDFLKGSQIRSDGSFTMSLFIDYPIGKKGFSFHPEVQYTRNNFDYYQYNINQTWMVINTSSVNLPLMLRYTAPLPSSKVRPYINVGYQTSFLLKNESQILEDVMDGEVLVSEKLYKADLLSRIYAGYIAGAGFQFNIHHRINFFAELRYSKSYAFLEPVFLDKREFFLLTGISF